MNLVLNDELLTAGLDNFDEVLPLEKFEQFPTDVIEFDTPGVEQRNTLSDYPIRGWALNYGVMNEACRNKLWEIFRRARGAYETFLYTDRDDYETSLAECSITAVGGETTTQLVKNYYPAATETWQEDKKDIVPGSTFLPVIKIDGVQKTEGTHFTLSDTTGIINWNGGSVPNGALGAGEIVTANYQFYFRVRFSDDVYADVQRVRDFWTYTGMLIVERV